jgi:hypothetical protein
LFSKDCTNCPEKEPFRDIRGNKKPGAPGLLRNAYPTSIKRTSAKPSRRGKPGAASRFDRLLPVALPVCGRSRIVYRGVRHAPAEVMQRIAKGERVPPNEYYLRTSLVFETASK